MGGGFDEERFGKNPGLTWLTLDPSTRPERGRRPTLRVGSGSHSGGAKNPFISGDILDGGEAFALFKIHHPVDHEEWIGLGEYLGYLIRIEKHE